MLKAVPSKDLLKLRGNDKLQSAMTISQQITAREVGKEGIYHGKVTRIEPWPFPQLGITGWRLAIEDQIKQGSTTMGVFAWVLVHKDPNGVIPKLRVGKDITVSGKISRTELSLPDQPRLNVDLTVLEMTMQK